MALSPFDARFPLRTVWPTGARVLAAATVIVVMAACSGGAEPTAAPTSTLVPVAVARTIPAPQPIVFPRDEAPHAQPVEWWYYSGHLEDETGGTYGFHSVVFQVRSMETGAVGYMLHASVIDPARGIHEQASRALAGEQAQPDEGFSFDVDDWTLEGTPALHHVVAGTDSYELNLTMTPAKPAALHDNDGFLATPEGWTYYYSWSRMETVGTLRVNGRELAVSGQSWMDHQWGDFTVTGFPAGWQWFAVQLDDGWELMVSRMRDLAGVSSSYGTLVRPDGTTIHVSNDEVSLEELGTWTSPHTYGVYPAGWRLLIPGHGLDIRITPVLDDQEITLAYPPNTIYWEGLVAVDVTREGETVGGAGFVELVGYVQAPGWTPPAP